MWGLGFRIQALGCKVRGQSQAVLGFRATDIGSGLQLVKHEFPMPALISLLHIVVS